MEIRGSKEWYVEESVDKYLEVSKHLVCFLCDLSCAGDGCYTNVLMSWDRVEMGGMCKVMGGRGR